MKQSRQQIWGGWVLCLCILLAACQHSPVRNPFEGRKEVKLGELPAIAQHEINGKIIWRAQAVNSQDPYLKLTPFVSKERIYVADAKGKMNALNKENGKSVWHKKLSQRLVAGPTVLDDRLLVGTLDAKVIALNTHTGQLAWEAKMPSRIASPPSGQQGVVLVHTIDGTVSALNAENGQTLWQMSENSPSLTLHFGSRPIIHDDRVIVGLSTGKLLALNIQDGTVIWERTLTFPRGRSELQRMVDISADPIIVGDAVYAINYQGKLAAVRISTGELLWERDISSYQNMAIQHNLLYLTDRGSHLWAIDRHSGETVWKQPALADRYITGPAVMGNVIVVADRGGVVHFLSADKGLIVGRLQLGGKIYQNPVVLEKGFLVASHKGKYTAFSLKTREEHA